MDLTLTTHEVDTLCHVCGDDAAASIDDRPWCVLHATQVLATRDRPMRITLPPPAMPTAE